MTASDLVELRLGAPTIQHTNRITSTVNATPTQIMRQDPGRVAFTLINMSINTLYMSMRDTVSTTQGIIIAGNGGALSMDLLEDFTLPALEWWAMAPAGASTIYLLELIATRKTQPTPAS